MQKSSAVAGIDWATELHAVCVLGNDGKVIERLDVTHDSQALHVMVSKFRKAGVTKVAIERGDGPVVQVYQRAITRGCRHPQCHPNPCTRLDPYHLALLARRNSFQPATAREPKTLSRLA